MLVLTRNVGQAIAIGDDIRIVIIRTRGSKVKIGIEAPKDRVVLREEVKQQSEIEQRKS